MHLREEDGMMKGCSYNKLLAAGMEENAHL